MADDVVISTNENVATPTISTKRDGMGFYRATIDYGHSRRTLRYSHRDRAAVILNAQEFIGNRPAAENWPYAGGIA